MIVDLDASCWAHLHAALQMHRRWCRENALAMPSDLTALSEHANRVRDRQTPPGAGVSAALVDAVSMSALTATYSDVARRLGVSKRTVERLAAAGTLPSVDVGGVPRIRVADLEAYVASLPPRVRSFREDITTKEAAS